MSIFTGRIKAIMTAKEDGIKIYQNWREERVKVQRAVR